jgi:hypothetical protein
VTIHLTRAKIERGEVSEPMGDVLVPEDLRDWYELAKEVSVKGTDAILRSSARDQVGLIERIARAEAERDAAKRGPCCREPWCEGDCTCEICAPELAIRDLKAENAQLRQQIADLERWKSEYLAVESTWCVQEVGKELGVGWGKAIHPEILPGIRTLKADYAALRQLAEQLRGALREEYFDKEPPCDTCKLAALLASSDALLGPPAKGAV